MAVTGYPTRDLLFDGSFVDATLEATEDLAERLGDAPPVVVGTVARAEARPPRHPGLHNVGAVLEKGRVRARVAKRLLPAYDVFLEPRWFVPGGPQEPVDVAGHRIGVLVCEDLWDEGYPVHPPAELRSAGAQLLVCSAALPYRRGNPRARLAHARRAGLPIVHVSAVGAQDELVFDGRSFVLDGEGTLRAQLPAFREVVEVVDVPLVPSGKPAGSPHATLGASAGSTREESLRGVNGESPLHDEAPVKDTVADTGGCVLSRGSRPQAGSVPQDDDQDDGADLDELHDALVLGIRGFAEKNCLGPGFLGLSGGIDSALVARLATDALGPERVSAVALPSRHTDPASTDAAREIASSLGIGLEIVPLETLHRAAETLLGAALDETPAGRRADENLQARLRMVVLMAHVNRHRGFLLNTSNKTEISLGYGTLYGDLAGALAPIADLTKLDVQALARHLGGIPSFVLQRPPTAELSPGQVDPFDYAVEAPRLEALVQGHRSDAALRRSEHKRRQFGVILKVSETAFGSGRLIPITRR
jgi:NAD+ synthase (glutamine-hydrolysing)